MDGAVGVEVLEGLLAEQEELLAEQEAAEREALEKLSSEVRRLRDVAVADRQQSGIEQEWRYCDAVMQNKDGPSGGESAANWYKPSGPDGKPLMKREEGSGGGRSKAFINITKSPVKFVAWAVKEMSLPLSGDYWSLQRTPEDLAAAMVDKVGQLPPEQLEALILQAQVMEQELLKKAEVRIKDMLVEGEEPLQQLAVQLFDAAAERGTGVVQGPIPLEGKAGASPGFRSVPVDSIYPDPACGDDIRNGSYIFEGPETKSARELRAAREQARAGQGGWILAGLEKVLEEGIPTGQQGYEFWYFLGELPVSSVQSFLPSAFGDRDAEEHIWVSCVLCGDCVVRLGEALLEGEITYHALKWDTYKREIGDRLVPYWAGRGVAVDLKSIQRTVNVNWRALDDNGQLAAIPQFVIWQGVIKPANNRYELEPGKFWYATQKFSEETLKEVQHAFMAIDIPCRTAEFRENVPFALSMIPQVTGIDDVVRGISPGKQVGTMQVQLNAGSHLAKRMTFSWQQTFRGMINTAIAYLRQYGDLPFTPTAKIEPPPTQIVRDVQASALVQALGLAINPAYGQDPKLLFNQWLISNEFDPERTKLSPEREKQLLAAQEKPDEKAQATVQSAQVRAEANVQAAAVDAEAKREQTRMQAENAARDREHERIMLELQYRMDLVTYASQRQIDLQTAMAELEGVKVPEKSIDSMLRRGENDAKAGGAERKGSAANPSRAESSG
jgi:hypothetical protein